MKIKINIPMPNFDFLNKINIGHIVLISAVLRFFVAPFPSDGGKIFDEAHYTSAVLKILEGVHANPEHPPLTKLIVAGFVKVLGNQWFAWRFPMIIFSLISTYLVYAIAKEFLSERLSLLAAGFVIFDIIWFIHGNIFMLEPPAIAFGLLFILFYLRGRYKWSSVAFSLSCLANEKALLFGLAVAIYHLMTNLRKPRKALVTEPNSILGTEQLLETDGAELKKESIFKWLGFKQFFVFFMIFGIVGIGGLQAIDLVLKPAKGALESHQILHRVIADSEGIPVETITETIVKEDFMYLDNVFEHALWMWQYYSGINKNLVTTKENFRPPWNWITPFGSGVRIFNHARYLVSAVSYGDKRDIILNYRAQTPIFIWYMTIPIIGLAIYEFDKTSKFILAWIGGTYVPWLIKDLIQANMTFNHYFQFTIPIICIGIPWFWNRVGGKHKNYIMAGHLVLVFIFFALFFPIGLRRSF